MHACATFGCREGIRDFLSLSFAHARAPCATAMWRIPRRITSNTKGRWTPRRPPYWKCPRIAGKLHCLFLATTIPPRTSQFPPKYFVVKCQIISGADIERTLQHWRPCVVARKSRRPRARFRRRGEIYNFQQRIGMRFAHVSFVFGPQGFSNPREVRSCPRICLGPHVQNFHFLDEGDVP